MARNATDLTKAEQVEIRNRHLSYSEQIMEMFTRGESYRAISRATDIPVSSLYKLIKELSAEHLEQRYGDRTTVMSRELSILDGLTRRNLKRAQDGDSEAARIVLESSRQRRRLLGLDAAIKAELVVKTAQDVEIERLVDLMRGTETADASTEQQ